MKWQINYVAHSVGPRTCEPCLFLLKIPRVYPLTVCLLFLLASQRHLSWELEHIAQTWMKFQDRMSHKWWHALTTHQNWATHPRWLYASAVKYLSVPAIPGGLCDPKISAHFCFFFTFSLTCSRISICSIAELEPNTSVHACILSNFLIALLTRLETTVPSLFFCKTVAENVTASGADISRQKSKVNQM